MLNESIDLYYIHCAQIQNSEIKGSSIHGLIPSFVYRHVREPLNKVKEDSVSNTCTEHAHMYSLSVL